MTPADRILKAAHMEIERKRALLDALEPCDAHQYVIRVKPRGGAWKASVAVEACEESV